MSEAQELAKKGQYTTQNGCCVGCIISKHGKIIGQGYNQSAGSGSSGSSGSNNAGSGGTGGASYWGGGPYGGSVWGNRGSDGAPGSGGAGTHVSTNNPGSNGKSGIVVEEEYA